MFGLRLDPIAFSIGSISVHWYGIILGTAALVGLLLAVREGKRFGLSPDFFMDLLLLGVPSAIVGARLYYVMFTWDEYKNSPLDVFKIWHGGIAIYGALIGAFICGIVYFRVKGYSFWRIADICAPSLIAGQMIGRWGNFVNQEAFGGPVEESFLRNTLHLPDWIVNQMLVQSDGLYHHPTFLYESLWNLVGLIILLVLRRRSFLRAGELLFSYFIWYSIGRFFIEGLRTDSLAFHGASWAASMMNGLWSPMKLFGFEAGYLDPAIGNIRISQLISVLLVIAAIILIIGRRTTGEAKVRYLDPIINFKTGLPAGTETAEKKTAASAESRTDIQNHSDDTGSDKTIKE
ncbi:prolipoprotein diacylglyceryl transferase [Paenibacillus taihuensis]|uniref:Phosphatidylglycerol--prolipoprotein diacylglyceryl transferase n=1 Tax=Paenibacillus taihuensis TaxID=1156355 RepID=A0A3D9QTF2_9BACL|nr:prolipoprotein diacylglyceryl transferase [Paenibacillus taihuensis]REE66413.1 prolipoprotein diacylglyceryl transferase [Paenibacillus taihuensis]